MKRLRKGSKAAKAWGRRMKALRSGGKKRPVAAKHLGVARRVKKRRRIYMAKRKFGRRSSGRKSFMSGIAKPTGLLAAALIGIGAASASALIPINVPYKEEVAAFAVGGVPSAAAVLLLKGISGTGSQTGMFNY